MSGMESKDLKEKYPGDHDMVTELVDSLTLASANIQKFVHVYKSRLSSIQDKNYGAMMFSTGVFDSLRQCKDLLNNELIQRLPLIDLEAFVGLMGKLPKFFVSPTLPVLLPLSYNAASDVFGPYVTIEEANAAAEAASIQQAEYAASHPGIAIKTYKVWILNEDGLKEYTTA